MTKHIDNSNNRLLSEIIKLIEGSKTKSISFINKELTMLYWNIGKHISTDLLDNGRAEYGKQVLQNLSKELTTSYGNGFGGRNLARMIKFFELFPENILSSLMTKLSWTHFIQLLSIKDDLQREFYATLCYNELWSVRTLKERINSMLYERTVLSKKPELTIKNDLKQLREEKQMSVPLAVRDPYILSFLGLSDTYSEKDLEQAIIHELQNFILEFGNDFAFLARQKRIIVDNQDYYIDLLFFHRKLNRLVAIELKLGSFEYTHKAQMELYLRWLTKYEQNPTENPPIGIILCANKSDELVQLLELGEQGIHIATYFTELPAIDIIKQKLKQSVENARNRLNSEGIEG